jgi:Ca2+-binding RTX toxin-like protein
MAVIFGTSNSEYLYLDDGVTSGPDLIYGFAGDDTLDAQAGDDVLDGGDGADELIGHSGRDQASYLYSTAAVTVNLQTGLGDGGDAEGDTLFLVENLMGSLYDDILIGDDDGTNELYGLVGNDTLKGGGGADILAGSSGNDTVGGGGGGDDLLGGEGSDTAAYEESPAGVTVSLSAGTASGGDATGDVLNSIENLTGSAHADWLEGDDGANVLKGLDGLDTLKGFGGADNLYGGDHDDTVKGGGGADVLDGGSGVDTADYSGSDDRVFVSLIDNTGWGGDADGDTFSRIENLIGSNYGDDLEGDGGTNVLDGASGDDELEGRGGADTLNGGSGGDTASYFSSLAGVRVSLMNDTADGGDAAGDELNSIENLTGSTYADTLWGDNNANVLTGAGGNDLLIGYGGDDGLMGGADSETLMGMDGVDILKGFGGADTLMGGVGGDTMLGGRDDDTYFVDDSADVVMESIGEGTLDRVRTTATYSLAAGSEVEVLETTFQAGTTALDLVGNEFNNTITGNDGVNTIVGGLGLDVMTGNGSGDVFVWTSTNETSLAGQEADVVMDFNRAGGDLLAFNPIDANATGGTNDDAFTFVGVVDVNAGGSFTAPGQIGYFTTATDTYILLNTEADAGIDYQDATIRVAGVHTVDASWFVL